MVAEASESFARAVLRSFCASAARAREQLSTYKVPARWLVATGDQIPTLASGKLDRKSLRQWVIQRSTAART